jgi:hypothetical protein
VLEAALRIQRTQRRRSSSGSAAAASDATTPAAISSASSRDVPAQAELAESAEPDELDEPAPQQPSSPLPVVQPHSARRTPLGGLAVNTPTAPSAGCHVECAAAAASSAGSHDAPEPPEPSEPPEPAEPPESAADEDDVREVAPPPRPPAASVDLTGATPPRPPHLPGTAWLRHAARLAAAHEAKRAKQASRFREGVAIGRMHARERRLLLKVTRMRCIFQAAIWAAVDAGDSDPEFAAYRALDAAGFAVELWDVERGEMRVFTHTCCATRLGEDGEEEGEDDGFAWTVWTFSNDDDLDAEPAYKAKEREGVRLMVAGERIVRCARALLVRRAAMPMDAAGLLRLETVSSVTTWVFA